MRKIWTPKSYTNWARVHKVSEYPSDLTIPNNIQLVHDITKYGYTEESYVAQKSSISLASPTTDSFSSGTVTSWNNRCHNWIYHVGFDITAGADADADARIAFVIEVPQTSGTSTNYIPLSEQFIIPKVTSEKSMVGFTLPMPFLMQPHWYPAIFWNGALAASTGIFYVVHIASEE